MSKTPISITRQGNSAVLKVRNEIGEEEIITITVTENLLTSIKSGSVTKEQIIDSLVQTVKENFFNH